MRPNRLLRIMTIIGGSNEINTVCPTITPTIGGDLWDAPASRFDSGIYHWTKYGNNTVENDTNTLKISYVDNILGAYVMLQDAADLSSNLIVNGWYQYQVDSKVNAGSSVNVSCSDAYTEYIIRAENGSAGFTTSFGIFRARDAQNCYVRAINLTTGEIIWLDNPSLKRVTATNVYLKTRSQQNGTYQCKPTVTDNTAAGLEICRLDDTNKLLMIVQRLGTTDQAQLFKISNGTWTSVIAGNITYGAASALKAIVNGTNVSLYYGGVQIGSTTAVAELATMGREVYGFSNYASNQVGEVMTSPNLA